MPYLSKSAAELIDPWHDATEHFTRIPAGRLLTISLRDKIVRSQRSLGEGMIQATVLVNPTSFKESIASTYSLRQVLGLSHEVAQFVRTGSRRLSFELWLSYHIMIARGYQSRQPLDNGWPNPEYLQRWRNFFESLLVPVAPGAAPPVVLVDWPGANLAFYGVLDNLTIEYERFTYDGTPMEMKLDTSFVEVASGFMSSPNVSASGLGFQSAGISPTGRQKPNIGK